MPRHASGGSHGTGVDLLGSRGVDALEKMLVSLLEEDFVNDVFVDLTSLLVDDTGLDLLGMVHL